MPPGLVNEHVPPAAKTRLFFADPGAIVGSGRVARNQKRAAAERFVFLSQRLSRLAQVAGDKRDVGSAASQIEKDRGADAERAASNECRFAGEEHG
jgi:hypothetical protein